jgi:hypothetical protein
MDVAGYQYSIECTQISSPAIDRSIKQPNKCYRGWMYTNK